MLQRLWLQELHILSMFYSWADCNISLAHYLSILLLFGRDNLWLRLVVDLLSKCCTLILISESRALRLYKLSCFVVFGLPLGGWVSCLMKSCIPIHRSCSDFD